MPSFQLLENPINTTRIVTGLGSLHSLADELKSLGATRPALIVDEGLSKAGLVEKWLPKSLGLVECGRAQVNPDLEAVQQAVAKAKEAGCDSVVALGGGSALCLGKALGLMLTHDGSILDYEGFGKTQRRPAPTICIPTTAGSGSEVSKALVLHEKGRAIEVVVTANGSEPHVAILDGQLLMSLPRMPMLLAGLDALTHSSEAMWVKRRNPTTDGLAEESFKALSDLLPRALKESPRKQKTMQALLEASTRANLACGGSGLGLVHALTTSPYVPLAHGQQNGNCLLAVARFNASEMLPQHRALVGQLDDLFRALEWPGRFQTGEIDAERARYMVEASQGHPFRVNNIRSTTDAELYQILRESGALKHHRVVQRQLEVPNLSGIVGSSPPPVSPVNSPPAASPPPDADTSSTPASPPGADTSTSTTTRAPAPPPLITVPNSPVDSSTSSTTTSLSSTTSSRDSSTPTVQSSTPTTSSPAPSTTQPSQSTTVVVLTLSGSVVSSASVVNLQASATGDGGSSNTSAWAIPVGVIGGIIGAGLLGFLLWTCVIKKRTHDREEPTDFDAGLRWPQLPEDDSHLPPTSVRQTGGAGMGDDADAPAGAMSMTSSPNMSKSGHSRASSMLDPASGPYSEDLHYPAYSQQQYEPYYADYAWEATTASGMQPMMAQAGLAPIYTGEQAFAPPTSQHYSPPLRSNSPPSLAYVQPPSDSGLGRYGSVKSVQSIAGQRPLGVANPDR